MMDRQAYIDKETLLSWLHESRFHVLEYSGRRAYIHDEDGDDVPVWVPVTLVRQLIADGELALWRDIGQFPGNKGYNTYRPAVWVTAWNQQYPSEKVGAA